MPSVHSVPFLHSAPADAVNSGDTAWVLASSALVLIMTPGVAFLYAGMVRRKNALNTMMQSYAVMAVVGVLWVVITYSLVFDGSNRFLGGLNFALLSHLDDAVPGFEEMTIPPVVFASFQMMFAIITPALITGAAAERWRFGAFLLFISVWSVVVYAPVAHWVFSPTGWAYKAGALDFAGGTVVHCNAGAAGLAIALVLRRRIGWPSNPVMPHNMPFVLLGVALMWFGWFGFNAGSALKADVLAGYAFLNTNTAAAGAVLTWMLVERLSIKRTTVLGAASGAVAGLVAITPAAGFVEPRGALAIGCAAGLLCSLAVAQKIKLRVDDSLDVAGLHLVGGITGSILVGVFCTEAVNPAGADGLLHGGGFSQIGIQALVTLVVTLYSFTATYGLGKFLDSLPGLRNRVSPFDEIEGLDWAIHRERAYETDDPMPAARNEA